MKGEVLAGISLPLQQAIHEALATSTREERDMLEWVGGFVDEDRHRAIAARHAADHYQVRKYLNLVYWCRHKFGQLPRFGAGPGRTRTLRILDIGCGPGHLGLVARANGHQVIGIDAPLDEPHLYTELCQLFGVEKRTHWMAPQHALPDLGKFDRIVSTMTEFDLYPAWDIDDWLFFFADAGRHLAPGGQIYITLTSSPARPPAVWEYFARTCKWSSGHHAFLF